ncbi:MAG: hypothetical protein LBK05_03525 [Treponema sp.]|jgi:hypothetical protein|nr:hypothetical protein [Treponema sp.]
MKGLNPVRVNQRAFSFLRGQDGKTILVKGSSPSITDGFGRRGFRHAGCFQNFDRGFEREQETVVKYFVIDVFIQTPLLFAAPRIRLFAASTRVLERFGGNPLPAVYADNLNVHSGIVPQKSSLINLFRQGFELAKKPVAALIRAFSISDAAYKVPTQIKRHFKRIKRYFGAAAASSQAPFYFIFGYFRQGGAYG